MDSELINFVNSFIALALIIYMTTHLRILNVYWVKRISRIPKATYYKLSKI